MLIWQIPETFIELLYMGTIKEAGTVTDPEGGPEEKKMHVQLVNLG